jgi:photosystem II PsbY protein
MVRVALGLVLILAIVGYSAFSVITTGQVLGIDARVFLVIAPILAALGWAAFNIGRAAVGQVQLLIRRSRA